MRASAAVWARSRDLIRPSGKPGAGRPVLVRRGCVFDGPPAAAPESAAWQGAAQLPMSRPDRASSDGALAQANEVRSARATLKKQFAAGTIQLAQILAAPPAVLQTARLHDLLIAVPKIGPVKAARILAHYGIAPSKTLGGLTDRQRRELINLSTANPKPARPASAVATVGERNPEIDLLPPRERAIAPVQAAAGRGGPSRPQ
jgi:hypothetical protein